MDGWMGERLSLDRLSWRILHLISPTNPGKPPHAAALIIPPFCSVNTCLVRSYLGPDCWESSQETPDLTWVCSSKRLCADVGISSPQKESGLMAIMQQKGLLK